MIDPRRRALALLSGGAVIPEEMDVSQVEVMPEMQAPVVPLARRAPVEMTSGAPVEGVATDVDEYAEALRQKHERAFLDSFSGSGIIEAFTGVGRSPRTAQQATDYANEPIAQYLQRQKEADKAREMELRAPHALAGKPQKSTDPASPESKRAQMLVRATLGDKFSDDEIAQITEADAESALKYGTLSGQREVTREGHLASTERATADRTQRAAQFAEMMGFRWADMSQDDRLALLRLADSQAGREATATAAATKREGELAERNVGGFDFDPQNPPSTDASKQMAQVAIQSKTISQGLDALEKLYNQSGTEIVGATAGTMGAEWKNLTDMLRNISNMGVPNGKDYEMLALQLENPTEIRSLTTSKARGMAQMKAVRDQIRRLVSATAEAYKFRPVEQARRVQPARAPVATTLPKDAGGQPTLETPSSMVRVMINGKPYRLPRTALEKARELAKQRGDAFEVSDG